MQEVLLKNIRDNISKMYANEVFKDAQISIESCEKYESEILVNYSYSIQKSKLMKIYETSKAIDYDTLKESEYLKAETLIKDRMQNSINKSILLDYDNKSYINNLYKRQENILDEEAIYFKTHCDSCNGTAIINCPHCNGTGIRKCNVCNGKKYTVNNETFKDYFTGKIKVRQRKNVCNHCWSGKTSCNCDKTHTVTCPICDGGKIYYKTSVLLKENVKINLDYIKNIHIKYLLNRMIKLKISNPVLEISRTSIKQNEMRLEEKYSIKTNILKVKIEQNQEVFDYVFLANSYGKVHCIYTDYDFLNKLGKIHVEKLKNLNKRIYKTKKHLKEVKDSLNNVRHLIHNFGNRYDSSKLSADIDNLFVKFKKDYVLESAGIGFCIALAIILTIAFFSPNFLNWINGSGILTVFNEYKFFICVITPLVVILLSTVLGEANLKSYFPEDVATLSTVKFRASILLSVVIWGICWFDVIAVNILNYVSY